MSPSYLQRRFLKKFSRKSTRRRVVRYGLLTANIVILIAVSGFVASGSRGATNHDNAFTTSPDDTTVANPIDQLSSADIAVQVARMAQLAETPAVTTNADSINAQLAVSSTDAKILAKPQVVGSALKSRKDIQVYKAQAGDTVSSLAAKFGITSDTIRWSNGLTGDAVTAGKDLVISPINGIVYTVKAGDTPESLAQTYRANKDQIVAFNDAELNGLPVGERIVIPDGMPPASPARATNVVSSGAFAWGGFGAVYGGNGYDYGYCTWWAASRRAQVGKPIPSNLGNASTWKVLAQRAGMSVGNTPRQYAVIWTPPRDYYGHVGFVESVNEDGSVNVSEMNVSGWARVSYKTLSAAEAAQYSYIY